MIPYSTRSHAYSSKSCWYERGAHCRVNAPESRTRTTRLRICTPGTGKERPCPSHRNSRLPSPLESSPGSSADSADSVPLPPRAHISTRHKYQTRLTTSIPSILTGLIPSPAITGSRLAYSDWRKTISFTLKSFRYFLKSFKSLEVNGFFARFWSLVVIGFFKNSFGIRSKGATYPSARLKYMFVYTW